MVRKIKTSKVTFYLAIRFSLLFIDKKNQRNNTKLDYPKFEPS